MRFTFLWRRVGGHRMLSRARRWCRASEAVAATEYAILMALIILVSVGIIRSIGEGFFNLYTLIANAVGDTI